MTTRYAVIGTGHRSQMYLDAIAGPHADVAELVALIDVNPSRREYHRGRHGAFAQVRLGGPDELEQIIAEESVDRVIVTSVDRLHAEHVVRALEAGADVVVEKPLTIDAPSARAIQEAIDRTGRSVVVTFNYRYSPRNTALKQIIASGEIGEVVSVVFEWVLDTQHGADYFRRWHRDKANSGGLFVHKAAHHFDLVNWWLADTPERVFASGGLRFYGRDNAEARARAGAPARDVDGGDPFALDLRTDERLSRLYLDHQHHDGYRRDQDVFSDGISIEDNLALVVDYARGATLSYSLNAHSPWEGYRVAVNGTEGRAELEVVERAAVLPASGGSPVDPSVTVGPRRGGARSRGERLTVQRHWGAAEEVVISNGAGSHGGGDRLLLADVFRGPGEDPYRRPSGYRDGVAAVAVGIAGNRSLESGLPVRIAELDLGATSGASRSEVPA